VVLFNVCHQLDGRVQPEQVVAIFAAGQLDGRRVEEAVAIWAGLYFFHIACVHLALPLWFHRAQVVLIGCIIWQVGQLAGGERWHRVPTPPGVPQRCPAPGQQLRVHHKHTLLCVDGE
jgi:hypothetical protein